MRDQLDLAKKEQLLVTRKHEDASTRAELLATQLRETSSTVDSLSLENDRLTGRVRHMERGMESLQRINQESEPSVPQPSNVSTYDLNDESRKVHFKDEGTSDQPRRHAKGFSFVQNATETVDALDVAALHCDLINFEHELIGSSPSCFCSNASCSCLTLRCRVLSCVVLCGLVLSYLVLCYVMMCCVVLS
jgi:hypothetical protein